MVIRYPDHIEVQRLTTTQQDSRGHYTTSAASWRELGLCRLEKDAHGASEINNANVQPHTYVIYMAKGSPTPKQGELLRVDTYRHGEKTGTIECQCTEVEIGYLHNRIWAR